MAVNKVIYGGNTLVDLTGDTVTAADLADGVKATGADGNPVIGLMQKVTIDAELSTTSTNPVQNKVIKEALDGKLGKNETAARATQDGAGNTISTTYASKADVSALLSTKLGVTATAYAATRDGAGNNIVDTYAKKTDISGMVKSVNGKEPDAGGNVNVDNMTGASDSAAGKAGLVPAPAAGAQDLPLCGGGTFKVLSIGGGGTGATTKADAQTNLGLNDAIVGLSISGRTITYTQADGGTGTITTQDTEKPTDMADYIVTSYRNGTQWYEVYKSGKVRQGGAIAGTGIVSSLTTVNLLKAYKDTNYSIFTLPYNIPKDRLTNSNGLTVQAGASFIGLIYQNSKTTTSFITSGRYDLTWMAEGQGE